MDTFIAALNARRRCKLRRATLGGGMDNDAERTFFRTEVERLTDRLYGTALRLTRNAADAEDLVSEAVTKAWANFARLEDRQAFPKWIFRILANTYISEKRRPRPTIAEQVSADDDETPFSLFEKLHQPFLLWWANPEQELINKLLREDIERALDSLSEGFREVVILVEINGYSYAEVADILAVPIGTVRSRLARARSMLQRSLWTQARAAGLTKTENADATQS
jgi:RNA polymerase sigma-70 factor (ECF subfamily)